MSRLSNISKGDSVNKCTAYINAVFNVNLARKSLKKLLENMPVSDMKIMNAHYAYTAIAEIIVLYLVRKSVKYNTKSSNKADLYEVSYENILQGVRESKSFDPRIKDLVNSFNPEGINYITTFFDTETTLRTFLETKTFQNTTNSHFNKGTLNCICYILSHTLSYLTYTSCVLSEFGKKKNIQIKNFKYASMICFSNELRDIIIQRIDEIITLFAGAKDIVDEKEDEQEEDEGHEGHEEEEEQEEEDE